jgi:CBS domain-containing protein
MKKIKDVMTRNVHLANPNQTIREAAGEMAKADIGSLPVGENDRLVGMITDRDIALRAVAKVAMRRRWCAK